MSNFNQKAPGRLAKNVTRPGN